MRGGLGAEFLAGRLSARVGRRKVQAEVRCMVSVPGYADGLSVPFTKQFGRQKRQRGQASERGPAAYVSGIPRKGPFILLSSDWNSPDIYSFTVDTLHPLK